MVKAAIFYRVSTDNQEMSIKPLCGGVYFTEARV